jgi:hypothetical protein
MKPPRITLGQMLAPPMSDDDFARWYVAEILQSEFPSFVASLGRPQCERQTRNGRRYATHFGITRPDLQGQFLTIMWSLGPSFFTVPEFRRILDRTDLTEEAKLDALYATSGDAGAQALRTADDLYWYPWLVPGNILGLDDDPEWDDDDDEGGPPHR